jgi:hypothetical protein
LKKKVAKKAPKKNAVAKKKVATVHKTSTVAPRKGMEWTVEELAAKEGVHEKTILLWIRQEKIKARHAVKEGGVRGKWFIPKATYKRPLGRNEK